MIVQRLKDRGSGWPVPSTTRNLKRWSALFVMSFNGATIDNNMVENAIRLIYPGAPQLALHRVGTLAAVPPLIIAYRHRQTQRVWNPMPGSRTPWKSSDLAYRQIDELLPLGPLPAT
ncbi:MAG: hypothetical protein IPI21_09375 [Propionivibrio sp.]|nr:hypothetical protein [Propionivibrio sp.]